jgi:FixJ family two-component response regulator
MKVTPCESLPGTPAAAVQPARRPAADSFDSSDRDTRKPVRKHVLLLDDDPSVRRDLGILLLDAGFAVRSFATARELLAYHRPEGPACLLLDIFLPDADGLDLQRQLAATSPDLPVVLITGHLDDGLRERALGSGAFALLAKPLDWSSLLSEIRQALAWVS